MQSNPRDINSCFASYYTELYFSKAHYAAAADLHAYLDELQLPELSEAAHQGLDAPLTLKELQVAISSLQTGKTSEEDGFPAEFYKIYSETLVIRFLKVLSASLKASSLPPSMSRAIIVVVPKPSKDPELCSSYRPSLLNVDV